MGWSRAFPTLIRKRSGDTVSFQETVRTDESGEPITSLAGYTLRHSFRASATTAEVLLSKQTSDGSIAVTGRVARWFLTPAESAAFGVGAEIFWDLQIYTPSEVSKTLRAGRIIFDPQITTANP